VGPRAAIRYDALSHRGGGKVRRNFRVPSGLPGWPAVILEVPGAGRQRAMSRPRALQRKEERKVRDMSIHPLAGKPAPAELLIDVDQLQRAYYERQPNLSDPDQLVSFGTSGHRGTALHGSFNEAHILATTQAICDYRRGQGIDGPLFMGKDPHALSGPAQRSALEVLAANGVVTQIQREDGFTPTPAISHAILVHNRDRTDRL